MLYQTCRVASGSHIVEMSKSRHGICSSLGVETLLVSEANTVNILVNFPEIKPGTGALNFPPFRPMTQSQVPLW